MKVHNYLGSGFQEVLYQRALAIEFQNAGLEFVREQEHKVYYHEAVLGVRRADFVVSDLVVVELKAVTEVLPVHIVQLQNYLTAYDKSRGLLINFGQKSLQFHNVKRRNHQTNSSKARR